MKKCAPPTSPRRSQAAPPAVVRGKSTAGPPQVDAAGLPRRIKQLVDLFDTQRDAAAFVGCAPETLQNWIAGRTSPGFEPLARLAQAKGVSLGWLATGLGDMADATDAALLTYSALPPDVRRRVDQAIELIARVHQQRESDIERVLRLTLSDPE